MSTYHIFSSLGFIGFCFINSNKKTLQGGLSLFETLTIQGNVMMYQQATKYSYYAPGTPEIDIITDLMESSIPSMRSNGLTYNAIDVHGNSQTI